MQKRVTTQMIEGPNSQIFCQHCNVASAFGLKMTGYSAQVINGNMVYRSAVFMGELTDAEHKLMMEKMASAEKEH